MWAHRSSLVTGGAGFIGSHLVDRLMTASQNVTVFDSLRNGSLRNLQRWLENERFEFIKGDLTKLSDVKTVPNDVDIVFHLAANPEVRVGETDPSLHFQENLVATSNLLEVVRQRSAVKTFVFFSTSTVYGDALTIPTPEEYGPTLPVSTYGASKLGCEALASSYANTFGFRTLVLRIANVVGSRSKHGVIIDFMYKLTQNPKSLEILGDGTQSKSYLYIDDLVDAVTHLTRMFLNDEQRTDLFNVGSPDKVPVKKIAEIVTEEMGLQDVDFWFTGGVDGGRGWKGDVKTMLLSIDKLRKTRWNPQYSSEQAVRLAVKALLRERQGGTR